MDMMRSKASEYDDAGQSCPESTRSCELPAVPASPGGPRQSSHSESDAHDELLKSGRPPAYSSPDLGIESDCQQCSSHTSGTVRSQPTDAELTPLPSEGETAHAAAADPVPSQLAATRAALQQTLARLGRAERAKAAVESAVSRQLGRTQQLLGRARGSLAQRPAEGRAHTAL
ncbi:uncharacterized protein LOC119103648 [Pollicipes pollicipes]|uniref:uncharacterized protein LOC119103648 n=1 Tax=Pollicipes pollicipes TaxID=41117 RepID=UPI0018853741|nr:uncharacterized protein LOC119103648 [Pollicipes pollicipes]